MIDKSNHAIKKITNAHTPSSIVKHIDPKSAGMSCLSLDRSYAG